MAGMRLETSATQRVKWRLPQNVGARLAWEGRRLWQRFGWPVAVGLACCTFALFATWQTQQSAQRRQALAVKLEAAQSAMAAKPSNDVRQGDIVRQIDAFYAYLPPHDAIPDQLKQLINLAEKNGVMLVQAEYKPQAEVDAGFLRYQIVLPVKAAYPSIQTFMLNALQALPTLTLESVAFKRDRIESTEVEARIHFVLLVKKPAAKGGGK